MKSEWIDIREEVLDRDDHTCQECGSRGSDISLEVHHIEPRFVGGSDDPSNLLALCHACHKNAHEGAYFGGDRAVACPAEGCTKLFDSLVQLKPHYSSKDSDSHPGEFDGPGWVVDRCRKCETPYVPLSPEQDRCFECNRKDRLLGEGPSLRGAGLRKVAE